MPLVILDDVVEEHKDRLFSALRDVIPEENADVAIYHIVKLIEAIVRRDTDPRK